MYNINDDNCWHEKEIMSCKKQINTQDFINCIHVDLKKEKKGNVKKKKKKPPSYSSTRLVILFSDELYLH